jgi:hypothetical protein
VNPGRVAWMPDDLRASIHSSTSAKSQATFRLVSVMRRGNPAHPGGCETGGEGSGNGAVGEVGPRHL